MPEPPPDANSERLLLAVRRGEREDGGEMIRPGEDVHASGAQSSEQSGKDGNTSKGTDRGLERRGKPQ